MRTYSLFISSLVLLAAAACSKAPVVNITTVPPNTTDVSFTTAYDIDEGAALDLVVDPGQAGAQITTSALPTNATLKDGIFSFTPDYSQAGLYSVTFTITSGETITTRTIGVRVLNVIHIAAPALTVIAEGGKHEITFTSNDPTGTIVTYSADVSAVPGAAFDPVAGKFTFEPAWDFLDTRTTPALAIIVTAEGQELDTGKQRTSTAKIVYQVNEATSFKEELMPLFMLPTGTTAFQNITSATAEQQSDQGHLCIGCHTAGGQPAFGGMDFAPFTAQAIYDQLVNHDVSPDGMNGSVCATLGVGVKRVVPNDLPNSLWFRKISATDGAGGPGPGCGAQMPNGHVQYYWTTRDHDQWQSCTNSTCRELAMCNTSTVDTACNLDARLVKKAKAWILAGAPNN